MLAVITGAAVATTIVAAMFLAILTGHTVEDTKRR